MRSTLTAAQILAETAGIHRSKSKAAYAMHNGTAPLPVWSGNKERQRLNRRGNRQLNTALRQRLSDVVYHTLRGDYEKVHVSRALTGASGRDPSSRFL